VIYCPHCRKPSAKNTGPCPHCGQLLAPEPPPEAVPAPEDVSSLDLDGSPGEFEIPTSSEAESIIENALNEDVPEMVQDAAPSPSDKKASHMGEESVDFGDDEVGTLEVQSIAPPPVAVHDIRKQEREATEMELQELAGYGKPDEGTVGDVVYAIRVWFRKRELVEMQAEAKNRTEAAGRRLRKARADLGRAAKKGGFEDDRHLASFWTRLKEAEARLADVSNQRLSKESQHKDKLDALENEARTLEQEIAPVRAEEEAALESLKRLRTDQKRTEARLKRIEIEIRNIEQLVSQSRAKLQNPALPPDEKGRLTSQLEEQEERKPAVAEEIRSRKEELERFNTPIAEAETRLAQLRQHISEQMGKASLKREESSRIAMSLTKEMGSFETQMKNVEDMVEEAWAAAGDKFFNLNYAVPEIEDLRTSILQAATEDRNAIRQAGMLAEAVRRYDRDAFGRGRKVLISAAVVLVFLAAFGIYFIFHGAA